MQQALIQTIEPEEVRKHGVSFPHTAHCLADGNIMISTLGDEHGNNKGNFLLLDGDTFEPKGCWLDSDSSVPFNYDFWYQPRRDVMISTEWGTPNVIKQGFYPKDVVKGHYGHSVHIFKWSTHDKIQTIDLPMTDGAMCLRLGFFTNLQVRMLLLEQLSAHAYSFFIPIKFDRFIKVTYIDFQKFASTKYDAKCVVKVPSKKVTLKFTNSVAIKLIQVEGWLLPEMPSLITDIIISMDDHYLYISNWIHGDVRQYDITDPENPRLNSQIFLGGSIHSESGVKIVHDEELTEAPPARYVKGKRVEGGPQMLQLSLDGKRLYVTTSLYRKWDEQFYPNLVNKGAMMLCVDIGYDGQMTLNENFLVDFGEMEGGPYLAHEMRYPGGDCTSDIWL
ncbi:selenium binding protein [Ostertagia ostertagi]